MDFAKKDWIYYHSKRWNSWVETLVRGILGFDPGAIRSSASSAAFMADTSMER